MSPRGGATAVTDLTGRIRVRRRGLWRKRLLLGGSLLLALALVAGGVWLVAFSRVFAVAHVDVTGTQTITPDAVRQAAAVPQGRPLARLDTKAVAERVRQIPEVADVFVRAKLPDRVEIAVTERAPVLALVTGTTYRLADADGNLYRSVASVPPGVVPGELVGLDANHPDPTLVKDLAKLASALTPAYRQGKLATKSRDTCTLYVGNKTVLFGSSDDAATKVDVATKLMAAAPKATVYDVSSPAHPVTR